MACLGFFLFIVMAVFLIVMERWWGLLGAIVRGDSSYLKEDILESGICEKKREEWSPKPKFKSIWDMTPEEREEDRERRREEWQRQKQRRKRCIIIPADVIPADVQPRKPKPRKRDALDDLADELLAELD